MLGGEGVYPSPGLHLKRPKQVCSFRPFQVSEYPLIFINECTITAGTATPGSSGYRPGYKLTSMDINSENSFDKLVTVDVCSIVATHSWHVLSPDIVPPFKFKADKEALDASRAVAEQTSSNSRSTVGSIVSSIGSVFSSLSSPFSSSSLPQETSNENRKKSRSGNITNTYSSGTGPYYKRLGAPFASSFNNASPTTPTNPSEAGAGPAPEAGGRGVYTPLPRRDLEKKEKEGKRYGYQSLRAIEPIPESVSLGGPRGDMSNDPASSHGDNKSGDFRPAWPIMEPHLSSKLFALLPEHRLLFSVGHWDNRYVPPTLLCLSCSHITEDNDDNDEQTNPNPNPNPNLFTLPFLYSIRCLSLDTYKTIQVVASHSDIVTCCCITSDHNRSWLVTGSKDCTAQVWELFPHRYTTTNDNALKASTSTTSRSTLGHNASSTGGIGGAEGVPRRGSVVEAGAGNNRESASHAANLPLAYSPRHVLYGHDDR